MISMKKAYKKPELFFEDFTLMDAITASCMVPAQHTDKYSCAWYNDDFGVNIYTQFVGACDYIEEAYEVGQDVVFPS